MIDPVAAHYTGTGSLADAIAERIRKGGRDLADLRPADLAAVDEFHIRGQRATLELAEKMNLTEGSNVLDIGSGLGGPARTVAEAYGCHVTGVDLTPEFCDAATVMSDWVGLADRVDFRQADATDLPFEEGRFDAAMTIHTAMNVQAKDRMYGEARRVLRPGGVFAIYDVLDGEGGDVLFPVPWAREPSISHLASPADMERLLRDAGFTLLEIHDSTAESEAWFRAMAAQMAQSGPPVVTFQVFLGDDFPEMARNQVRNLSERRIRTVSYICET